MVFGEAYWSLLEVIVGLLDVVVAIGLAVVLYRREREQSRKEIMYTTAIQTPVWVRDDLLAKRIKLLLDDKPVNDLQMAVIEICNGGNTAVLPTDYDGPLTLSVGSSDTVQLLEVECLRKTPGTLRVEWSCRQNLTSITPLLLNPNEGFAMKLLFTGPPAAPLQIGIRAAGTTLVEARSV